MHTCDVWDCELHAVGSLGVTRYGSGMTITYELCTIHLELLQTALVKLVLQND